MDRRREPADYKDVSSKVALEGSHVRQDRANLQCIPQPPKERTQAHEQTASHVLDCRVRGIRR